jgi:glycosyltransferase EpsF
MNYYRHIDKTKVQFDFLIDEDSTNIPKEEIESMGGRIILIPPYQKLPKYIGTLKEVLKQNQYKIIHSHINTLSVFPLYTAKRAGVKIRIAHSHSTTNKKEWKKNILKNIFKPYSKVFATDYFACSALAGRWLFSNKTFNQGKVTIINNAIDIDKFLYNETIRKQIRKKLNIKDNTLVIGHIGRFVSQKNHTFLLDIFNEIHKQKKDSLLLLAGTGPLVNEIKEKVNALNLTNNVKFLGQINNANELYQAMDVFLLPSLYEGLPVVGVEAQAAGLLTILSTSMTEETKILKTTKFISLEESSQNWASTIINNYSKFKRKNTKLEIQKNGFDIKKETKKLEQKYIELNRGW